SSPLNFSDPSTGYSYMARAANDFFSVPGQFSTNQAFDDITFDTFAGPCDVTAISCNVWNTDINFNVLPGIVTVTMSTGDQYIVPAPGGPSSFVGVMCASPIVSIKFTPDTSGPFTWVTIANFTVSAAAQ